MIEPTEEPISGWLARERLEIRQVLYKVGNTAVYRAYSQELSRPVALKLLLCMNTNEVAMREAENQEILEHSNVVRIYRYVRLPKDERSWVLCLEEELMDSDLSNEIKRRNKSVKPWKEEEIGKFVVDMVEVLAFAQAMGIAHRDIKPQNVLLTGTTFKLADFGWSRRLREEDRFTSLSGTPNYLSPVLHEAYLMYQKQVLHNPYKSDVFSLGLTVLSMVRLVERPELNSSTGILSAALSSLKCADWLQALLALMLETVESLRPDFIVLADLLRACSSRGSACTHSPSCSRFQACSSCLRPTQFIGLCSRYLRSGGQLTGTPAGMETCSACSKVLVEGDLVPLEAPAGIFCTGCLQTKLDEEEVTQRCRSSLFSLIYYSMLNAL